MRWETRQKPEFAICKVTFDQSGEQIVLEGGAMVARDTTVQMTTGVRGGLMGGLKRMVSRESLFQNTFTATAAGQTVWFAPGNDGDLEEIILDGQQELMIASSAFVACAPTVKMDTKFQGFRGFFGGTGLFMVRCEGSGPVWFTGFGALHRVEITPDRPYIVDNGHIAAFAGNLNYTIRSVGGIGTFLVGGEALVCEFTGSGTVWVATRSQIALLSFLAPYRPRKSN